VTEGSNESAKSVRQIWDLHTGKEIGRFPGEPAPLVRALFSPDDRKVLLATSFHYLAGRYQPPTVQVWDVATLQPFGPVLPVINNYSNSFQSAVAFSPDGKRILVANQLVNQGLGGGAGDNVGIWNT